MALLTKKQSDEHQKVMDLIQQDKPLRFEEKEFILWNYQGDGIGAT